ncbi:hypothetical protein BpHYR1_045124 [Brachionus plicatilis]|uniref:Uncharacterized protein n=1 Tax=Brachionus plicatilis TaxID=10195 RepID=A0A3M7PH83_BRAPC|nr:hypothetical protein BpHYR1_045124 [Brachionus plicatilis]
MVLIGSILMEDGEIKKLFLIKKYKIILNQGKNTINNFSHSTQKLNIFKHNLLNIFQNFIIFKLKKICFALSFFAPNFTSASWCIIFDGFLIINLNKEKNNPRLIL